MDVDRFNWALTPLALLGFPTAWVGELRPMPYVPRPKHRSHLGTIEALRRHRTPAQGAARLERAARKRARRAARRLGA